MRTESVRMKRTLKSKTQSIETSVLKLTRSKAMSVSETLTPEQEISHIPLSRASSLPATSSYTIERDPLPVGSDVFQSVLKEINDETTDIPSQKPPEPENESKNELIYQPPKLKKTSNLRRTQSERIPGRSVRFGGFEIEGDPSPSPRLFVRLSSEDFHI